MERRNPAFCWVMLGFASLHPSLRGKSQNLPGIGITTYSSRRRFAARLNSGVCAGHGKKRVGCKSRYQVYAEPKVSRRARASPRGGVWRKSKAKSRGDEQKPDTRRGASGASGHVTAKPSICDWGVLCKSGVYARTVSCLTPGGLSGASATRLGVG